jgi:hypothetical protein
MGFLVPGRPAAAGYDENDEAPHSDHQISSSQLNYSELMRKCGTCERNANDPLLTSSISAFYPLTQVECSAIIS